MNSLDFLHKLFFNTPLSQVWVGWSDGKGGFPGGPADRYLHRMPPRAGHYFCIGSLKPGHTQRRLHDIQRIHAFVLDDMGTKAPMSAVEEILDCIGPPTWVMETSENNFQYGWVYATPLERKDFGRHQMLVTECVKRWGVDRAGADPNRLVRLPSGFNLKEERNNFAVILRYPPKAENGHA